MNIKYRISCSTDSGLKTYQMVSDPKMARRCLNEYDDRNNEEKTKLKVLKIFEVLIACFSLFFLYLHHFERFWFAIHDQMA